MKSSIWIIGAVAATIAYLLINRAGTTSRTPVRVEDLAHKLQDAWADHHTVA